MRTFLVVFIILASLTAFGSPSTSENGQVLARIKERGSINIGYRETSIPFSYLSAQKKPIGYSIDICNRIVDAISKQMDKRPEVKYVLATLQTRLSLVQQGAIDLECGATTNTLARQQAASFSLTIFVTGGIRTLVKASSGLSSWEDLRDKKVVFTKGTISETTLKQNKASSGFSFQSIYSKDNLESARAVESGLVDAFVQEELLLLSMIAKLRNPSQVKVIGEPLSPDPYAIMLPRDDAEFKQIVDEMIAQLAKSGELARLYNKWFNSPLPSGGSIEYPMSSLFMNLIAQPNDRDFVR